MMKAKGKKKEAQPKNKSVYMMERMAEINSMIMDFGLQIDFEDKITIISSDNYVSANITIRNLR